MISIAELSRKFKVKGSEVGLLTVMSVGEEMLRR
jgi:hypothetical protein